MTNEEEALKVRKALDCPLCGARPHHGLGKVEHCSLHGEPFQRFSVWCPKGHVRVTGANEERALEEWNTRPAPSPDWRPISEAPKDGTRILFQLRNPLPVEGREDLERWHGIPFVARHPGVADDGFDIGWNFAAPVGHGGFPDNWIAGWLPLPTPPSLEGK